MTIEWRTVAEFPQYIVSDEGEVRRAVGGQGARVGRPLKWHFGTTTKYPNVRLTVGGVVRARCVHKLVSRAFLGPMPDGMQVRHLDGDTMNCRAGNLAYGTHKENQEDKVRHGTSSYGEKNPRAKLTAEQAKAIVADYGFGISARDLASQCSVNPSTIHRIVKGIYWRHEQASNRAQDRTTA
jgi:hypothetical protein